jgi:hypothetical protein
MDSKDSTSLFATHSTRNVFRRHLQESQREQFKIDVITAISALESPRNHRYRREYLFTPKEEDALENLLFPKQILTTISQNKWSHEPKSEHYLHLMMPKVTVQTLLSHAHIKRLKAGSVLNVQNGTGCPLIVILDGQCQGYFSTFGVDTVLPDDLEPADFERTFGQEQCTLDPGDIFGCEMFCHRNSSSMTLIAKSNVVALRIEEKILLVLIQQWKRMDSFSMPECRHLLDIKSPDATKMITDILQMQCTLGTSELFAKKRKISMKHDLSGCMLATIPAGVDAVQFLAQSFRSSNHDFLALKMQECFITCEEHIGAFVVLSGSFAVFNQRSFENSFRQSTKNVAGWSILGPSSMVELNDPFLKQKCFCDEELQIISREQSDVLLVHQDQTTRMAFQAWFSHSDSVDLETCTAVARTLIAIDSNGKHAKTSSTCSVGDIFSLCSSEARKSHAETPGYDHMMNVMIHKEGTGIVENVLKSQLSPLLFLNSYHIKALAACVELMIRMPVAVHQSHARKIFHTAITDSDLQTCCVIILRGSCVSQSTVSAKCSGMQNEFAKDLFGSMSNVPSDNKIKRLKSQDILFIESMSSLQMLSQDFLAMTLPIHGIDSWADDCMSTWVFAKHTLNIPCSNSLEKFYSKTNRLVEDESFVKKDVIPVERKLQSRKVEPLKMSFVTPTHSSRLKRSSTTHADFFDDLRSKNDKSFRLRLRRSIRESESFEELLKRIIYDKAGIAENWTHVDVNSSGVATMSELQNWLTMQFPQRFKTSKVIFVAFRETLKHFRIISRGSIELRHFSYFIQLLIDYVPAELVFDELDVNRDGKFSLSEFTVGMKKMGLEINEIELGSDFKDILDAHGIDATFDCFCRWFHRHQLKDSLLVKKKQTTVVSDSVVSSSVLNPILASSTDLDSLEDLQVEMCTVLHLHPLCKLIPDRVALDLPFEILKVSKGAIILQGSSFPATRHIMFIIEGIVASLMPDSSCNPICLSAGSSVNQTVSSPWHKNRTASKFYCGSASIGDSNFFLGVGDGLEYIAVTDVVIMVLRWQFVQMQWQHTMLMDLQSQNDASEYFLWSKTSASRSNFQQMKLLSFFLNKQCESTIDKSALSLLCCHSQLCITDTVSVGNVRSPGVASSKSSITLGLPSDATLDPVTAPDASTLQITFEMQMPENSATEADNSDLAQNSLGSASEICQGAIAFIVTGPAYITIKAAGLSVLSQSKQADDSISGRQTKLDFRQDPKRHKVWHVLAGHCAIVTSEQLASVCRGRINFSREKNVLSMFCNADKCNLFHYPMLSATFLSNVTSGSVASIDDDVKIALLDMCCTNFLQHVSSCYSNHSCFSANSISNLALSHAGSRAMQASMGETVWKLGQDGIFVVLEGTLRVMFSFGELQLIPDSRRSGMSVTNHSVEMLCLGQMSIFGDIGECVSSDIDGHIFVDCAETACELLYFPPSAVSCLSSKCQTDLKKLIQSRAQMLKQCMLTQKNILHSAGFQREKMHIMQLAESDSKRVQFMREPNKYSQISDGKDAIKSIADVSALRHFTSSKTVLIKNSCFQSLNENVKECSAHMASFYKQAGRQSRSDYLLETEARNFEENMSSLNILPLNSAPKLKRLLKKERQFESTIKNISDGTTPSDISFDSVAAPIIPFKHVSDAQKRINAKIFKLKSDDNLMEAFKNRVSQLLTSMPSKSDLEKRNKDVSSYATPEAKARRLQANSAIMKQRCEQAKTNSMLLESSFKESTAQKLEEDRIRIQNNLLLAENRLRQKHLVDFQMEIIPVLAMVSRFHLFMKLLLSEVPKARQTSLCIIFVQRWVRKIQLRKKIERKNRVRQTFRRAFRRFKMMYCLWKGTFALKLLIKFMRERKKARQVTFVIRSYM